MYSVLGSENTELKGVYYLITGTLKTYAYFQSYLWLNLLPVLKCYFHTVHILCAFFNRKKETNYKSMGFYLFEHSEEIQILSFFFNLSFIKKKYDVALEIKILEFYF